MLVELGVAEQRHQAVLEVMGQFCRSEHARVSSIASAA